MSQRPYIPSYGPQAQAAPPKARPAKTTGGDRAYMYCGCAASGTVTLAVFARTESGWALIESHPAGADAGAIAAGRELAGEFTVADSFAGCRQCGARSFIVCGACDKLSCWQGSGASVCGYCGYTAEAYGSVESLRAVE